MDIKGKVAVVFGGANGIGRAYCEALLSKAAKVCFGDISKADGEATEKELQKVYGQDNVCFLECDACKEDQINNVFDKAISLYGPVEIAVNNCGILDEKDWKLTVDVNLGSNIRCLDAARQYMGLDKGGKGGAFVCTSSIAGLVPQPYIPLYSATKHAVVCLLRSWAENVNFKIHGIKMNSICPTVVDTNFVNQICPERLFNAEKVLKMTPGKKLSPSVLGEGLIKLLEEGRNGEALKISTERGFEYAVF